MSRSLAVAILLALVAGVQLLPATASADDAANVATYRKFIDSINKGDVAGALALFADDASLSGVRPSCVPNPCVGRAAIQNQLQIEVNTLHLQLQLLSSVMVVNGNVTALVAHRNDPIRAAGLSRVITTDTVTFTGDRISKFVVEPQASDPETAAFLRAVSQPSPAPAAPSAAVVPPAGVAITAPSTGDGGLATPARSESPFVPAVVLLSAATLTIVALRHRTAPQGIRPNRTANTPAQGVQTGSRRLRV